MPIAITKNIEERIIALLTKHPHLRDSDDKLVSNIWVNDVGGADASQKMSVFDFLKMYSNGEITMADSITRIRRKVQTEHPELRGNTYKDRPNHEERIESDLGYNKTKEPYPQGGGYTP